MTKNSTTGLVLCKHVAFKELLGITAEWNYMRVLHKLEMAKNRKNESKMGIKVAVKRKMLD